jgi:hypothetical protein
MPKSIALLATLLAALLLAGCASTPKAISSSLAEDRTYKTQVNMWADRGVRVHGTNYKRGDLIPLGTEVEIQSAKKRVIVFTVPSRANQTLQLVNDHGAGVNLVQLFERTFDREAPGYAGASGKIREAIEQGDIIKGMTRDQVLLSRGYPPRNRTPSLELDRWRYWDHRFSTRLIHFGDDGKVTEITD